MGQSVEERGRVLALLKHNHDFPGPYSLKAIVRAGDEAAVVSAVAATRARVLDVAERPSSKGSYVSVRLRLHAPSAEAVLDVYDVLSELDSVLTTL